MNKRIHSLDSLRGIAALIVLTTHCLIVTPLFFKAFYEETYDNKFIDIFYNSILHTFWAGNEAVILFFILSGFVLSLPFIKENKFNYGEYIVKRICRIYLPYIVVMAIASLLMLLLADYNGQPYMISSFSSRRWDHPLTFESIVSYIFMLGYDITNVNGPTWSLVHEMRISFFFPLIMLIVLKFNWFKSLIIGFGITMLFWAILYKFELIIDNETLITITRSFRDTFFYSTFFIIGAVFGKNLNYAKQLFSKFDLFFKIILFFLALTLINIDEVFPILRSNWNNPYINLIQSLSVEWLVAPGILIIFMFAIFSPSFEKVLTKPYLLWLGKVSYSFYLTHMVVLITTMYTLGKVIPVYLALGLVPIISFIAASLVHRFVEVPSQKLGTYLTNVKKTEPGKLKQAR